MNLLEMRSLVWAARGGIPMEIAETDQSIRWAMEALVAKAVELRSSRMLARFHLDMVAQQDEYPMPDEVFTVRGVDLIGADGGKSPLTPLTWPQREHPNEQAFSVPPLGSRFECYSILGQTLRIYPKPGESRESGIELRAWATPPIPDDPDEHLKLPTQAHRWVAVEAALAGLPPMNDAQARSLMGSRGRFDNMVRRWLISSVEDIAPSLTADGVL